MTHSRHCRCFSALSLFGSRLVFVHSKDRVVLPQNDVHTEFIRKKSRYETHSWLGLARPPEADLDGVGICEIAAVVPHPVAPSTGPLDHSPKLRCFSMGNPVSVCYGLVWPSCMDELWVVVMVCPASIGPTEAHLSLVIMGDAEEVILNNAKVPWHDGWAKRETYELVGCKLVNSTCIAIRRLGYQKELCMDTKSRHPSPNTTLPAKRSFPLSSLANTYFNTNSLCAKFNTALRPSPYSSPPAMRSSPLWIPAAAPSEGFCRRAAAAAPT